MNTIKKRDAYFDNLKFLLIALVVIGHTLEPMTSSGVIKFLYILIYLFHMPLFSFVTGYFSKKYSPTKLLKTIAIPYMIFQVLYFLFTRYILGDIFVTFSFFTPYWIMWYLLSLLVWQLVIPMFDFRYSIMVVILIGILAGYDNSVSYFFSLSRTIYFFPFFLMGYKFNKGWFFNLMPIKPRIIISILGLLGISIGVYTFSDSIDIRLLYGSYSHTSMDLNFWYAGLYRLLLYTMTTVFSFFLLFIVPSRTTFFTVFGSRTLNVYLLHGFIIKLMVGYNIYAYFSDNYKTLSLILVGFAITFILSTKFFNYLLKPLYYVNLDRLYRNKTT